MVGFVLNYGRPNFGGPPTRAEDMVDARQGSSRRTPISRDASTRRNLINFYRRTFAVFDASLLGALFAQRRDAKFPNFIVDLAKGGFRKFVRRRHRFLELRDARKRAADLFGRQRFQNLANIFDFRNPMTNHYQIVASGDREPNGLFQSVSIQDRAHVEIVGHDQAVESEFVAQQIGDYPARQTRRRFFDDETRIPTVTNHHAVHAIDQLFENRELVLIQLFARPIDLRQFVMRVRLRGRVSGKMFTAAGDPLFAHRVVERAGIAHHLLDGFTVTSAAQRIIRVIFERNVEHRAQIEIESENTQQTSGDIAVAPDKIDIVLVAQLLRVWRFASD